MFVALVKYEPESGPELPRTHAEPGRGQACKVKLLQSAGPGEDSSLRYRWARPARSPVVPPRSRRRTGSRTRCGAGLLLSVNRWEIQTSLDLNNKTGARVEMQERWTAAPRAALTDHRS